MATENPLKFPIEKQETPWFDKATLLDVIRFTAEQQLGEPPSVERIQSAPNDAQFPVVWMVYHEKTPDVDWESFYRCGICIDGQWYRVAVEPSIWERLPIAVLDVPIIGRRPQQADERVEILDVESDVGEPVVAIEVSMEPYVETSFLQANDASDDSRIMLQQIATIWPRLWPEMRTRFEEAASELDLNTPVDGESLIGLVSRLTPGEYLADSSDTYVSLRSEDNPPDWDYFLRDGQIIHFQPVF
jgi:hypothetical protein